MRSDKIVFQFDPISIELLCTCLAYMFLAHKIKQYVNIGPLNFTNTYIEVSTISSQKLTGLILNAVLLQNWRFQEI